MPGSVFISHRGADRVEAERLARALEAAGLKIWLDEWEILSGDSIVEQMHRGLSDARWLVLCCGAEGVEAPWISREWMPTLARQLEGEDIVLLPALLDDGRPPAILADIKYADLGKDFDAGVAALVGRIKGEGRR